MALRLPNAHLAIIDRRKITHYLLARNHHAGRGKAIFFGRFGFTARTWRTLRDALIDHARSAPVVVSADTAFGRKYTMEGPLAGPDGRAPLVRAIWFIETGEEIPKFVTAYPMSGAER